MPPRAPKALPKRTRPHAISTASGRALLAAMPDRWTVEEKRNDYGVDFDVEIFHDGSTTGLHFGVQLKSTEKVGRKASVRIKRSTANYWSSLEYPVLIVLYEATRRRLWWHWWHRHDPHGADETAAKFTLHLPEDQVWDSSTTPSELEQEVAAYRAWSDVEAHLPLSVIIRGRGDVAGIGAGLIIAAVRRRLRAFENLLVVRSTPAGVLTLTVTINPDESIVWLSGGGSGTLHHQGLDGSAFGGLDVAPRFSADLVLMLADRIAVLGLRKEAARLAASAMRDSSVISDPEVAQRTLFLLLEGDLPADAVDLLGFLVHRGTHEVGAIATLMALSWAREADEDARRRVIDALTAWPTERNEAEDTLRAAQFTYNAAQLARLDSLEEARTLLVRAGELDSSYRDRAYWWREQGGLLFLLGRHGEAAEAYRRALALGDTTVRPLLADALLWSDVVREALDLLREVAVDPGLSTAEWRLKARVLPRVNTQYEAVSQRRARIFDAQALHELATDAGLDAAHRTDYSIGAALAAESSPELWLHAMAMCLEDPELFQDVAVTARRFCGEEMIDLVLDQGLDPTVADALLEMFEKLPADPPAPNVLRFISPDSNEVEVVDLSDPSEPG